MNEQIKNTLKKSIHGIYMSSTCRDNEQKQGDSNDVINDYYKREGPDGSSRRNTYSRPEMRANNLLSPFQMV